MLSSPVVTSAVEGPVFGPEEFLRSTGKPILQTRTFDLQDAAPPFRLVVHNGGVAQELPSVASAVVRLNGSTLFAPRDFRNATERLERELDPILLTATNELAVEVRGIPGSGLTVTLLGELPDPEPPEIRIVSPSPDLVTPVGSVTVEGTFTGDVESVTVEGLPAILEGTAFRVDGVPLVEGTNRLVAVATGSRGETAVAGVAVRRDTAPPRVVIETPVPGARVVDPAIAVAGTVNDLIPGATVNADDVTVTVNGHPAQVLNRTFFLDELPLSLGENTLTAVAVDRAGNTNGTEIVVRREPDLAGVGIEILRGNGQRGAPGELLPQPFLLRFTARDGSLLAGRVVTFTVSRGDGLLETTDAVDREVTLRTNEQGEAAVTFRLGSRTGEGFHRVRVDTPGTLAFAELCATAEPGEPRVLSIARAAPVRGLVGRPLAEPLRVIVTDDDGNPVPGVPVDFDVELGGGSFAGEPGQTVATDADGIASAVWTLGSRPGSASQRAVADFVGNPGLPAVFDVSAVEPGPMEETRVSGVVQDSTGRPIEGARAVLREAGLTAVTGADGRFVIEDVPPGGHHVVVEGSVASEPSRGVIFPDIEFEIQAFPGVGNALDQIVILPFLDAEGAKWVGGNEDVILEMKGLPGFQIQIFAHSVILPDGTRGEALMSSSQVQIDKVPMPPPQGSTPLAVGTLQPPGIRFDPPARVVYPNLAGLAPGDVADVFAFHHDIGQFVNVGPGTVTEDAAVVVTDPGFGLVQSGWHCLIRMPGSTAFCTNDCTAEVRWRILEGEAENEVQRGEPVVLFKGKSRGKIEVTFAPGGGHFAATGWGGADPELVTFEEQAEEDSTAQLTLRSEDNTGPVALSTPSYFVPVLGKACIKDLELIITTVQLRQDGDLTPLLEERGIVFIEPEPKMPALGAELEHGVDNLQMSWRSAIEYTKGNRDDVCLFPGPSEGQTRMLGANSIWDLNGEFGDQFCGGTLELHGALSSGDDMVRKYSVQGKNPSRENLRQELSLLRHHLIAWRESRFQQFQTLSGFVRSWEEGPLPLLHSDDNGLGVMQLTSGSIPIGQLWNWKANVNEGEKRANGFTTNAQTYNNQVQQGSAWNFETGGDPPNEGTAFPDAPEFTQEELDKETWARYNSGFRYHDYDPIRGEWVNRNPNAPGNQYADDLATRRDLIRDRNIFPPLWGE